MKEVMNIYQRINAVMKEVKYVQKDKQISGGGANYKAVTHDQVISVCREKLVEFGVVIYPEQLGHTMPVMRDVANNVKMHLYDGDYAIHFVNIDDPENRITVTINAQANDNGDKAPGKCVTYATKTAILKVLCLETGENDESRADEADTEVISQSQVNELIPLLCDEHGMYTELGDKITKAFKFNNIDQIPARKFDTILKRAQSK